MCAHAAVEENDAERDRADEVCQLNVVEGDASGPVFSGNHAEQQKNEQQRRAGARGESAHNDARRDHRRADQDQVIDVFHFLSGQRLRGGPALTAFFSTRPELDRGSATSTT